MAVAQTYHAVASVGGLPADRGGLLLDGCDFTLQNLKKTLDKIIKINYYKSVPREREQTEAQRIVPHLVAEMKKNQRKKI